MLKGIGLRRRSVRDIVVAAVQRPRGAYAPRIGHKLAGFIDLGCLHTHQDDRLPVEVGGSEERTWICRDQRLLGLERLDPYNQRFGSSRIQANIRGEVRHEGRPP